MRLFKTKWFSRFARKRKINDDQLLEAVDRAVRGLVDADLGGGLLKQRVARTNEGRSGGYRTIIVFRAVHRAVFVYGFSKNDRDNLSADELAGFKELAVLLLSMDDEDLKIAVNEGALEELMKNEEDIQD
ncbi:MAG: type II toxin-antitoxin system RelE/ParE family toxin [Fimbriimonadaceae bacterium]|nr:type II toxin-antitoxin system RelE/ParE family toxin [Fimbriimonadaceae bacterium]